MLTLKEFLHEEVKLALGCTEPGAVALAVARACQELKFKERISSVKVVVSDSIYKNGMSVGIPGASGTRGNAFAAALGVVCGKAEYGLEVLKDCQPADIIEARKLLELGLVKIVCDLTKHGVYVEVEAITDEERVICIIEKFHSNIVKVVKNDVIIFEKNSGTTTDQKELPIYDILNNITYVDLLKLVNEMDEEDEKYVLYGARINKEIAEYGLANSSSGLNLGQALVNLIKKEILSNDLGYIIKSYCYAASDARMSGVQMPVMSSAGSGNHGITAILPIAIAGEKLNKSEKEIARAIVISHLSTGFIKSKIGRLSPVCGCAVAAGAGAAAGLAFLMGGNIENAILSIKTLLANTAGMVCDGAKETCALKVGTAASEAYIAALLSLEGVGVREPQGVVDDIIDKTVDNVARINNEGMRGMDRILIEILELRNNPLAG